MINRPAESELAKLADMKIDKNTPLEDRVIHMHFFLDGHDWYLSEYDPQKRVFFGYMVPKDDYRNARWDYFSIDHLDQIKSKTSSQVIRNTHWEPKPAIKIDRIRDAYNWKKEMEKAKRKMLS